MLRKVTFELVYFCKMHFNHWKVAQLTGTLDRLHQIGGLLWKFGLWYSYSGSDYWPFFHCHHLKNKRKKKVIAENTTIAFGYSYKLYTDRIFFQSYTEVSFLVSTLQCHLLICSKRPQIGNWWCCFTTPSVGWGNEPAPPPPTHKKNK